MAIRTFLALDLDAPIRDRLTAAVRRLPEEGSKIRWVPPENLHVTLKFLGDVAESDVADVCDTVRQLAADIEPFDFDVLSLRCVPSGGRVRMVWAEVREPAGRLASVFQRAEDALSPLGFPRERRGFHGHVTLGRVKFIRNAAALRAAAGRYAGELFGTQHAGAITVYRSQLTPQGAVYTPMARANFRPA